MATKTRLLSLSCIKEGTLQFLVRDIDGKFFVAQHGPSRYFPRKQHKGDHDRFLTSPSKFVLP